VNNALQFCQHDVDACADPGTCVPRPASCLPPTVVAPRRTLGCSGTVYDGGGCQAAVVGDSVQGYLD
jgi:hypothetical protein